MPDDALYTLHVAFYTHDALEVSCKVCLMPDTLYIVLYVICYQVESHFMP